MFASRWKCMRTAFVESILRASLSDATDKRYAASRGERTYMHSSLGWVDCTADKIGAACLIGLAIGLGSLPASAQLKPEARHAFEHFQELPPHRALAIEPNGNAH